MDFYPRLSYEGRGFFMKKKFKIQRSKLKILIIFLFLTSHFSLPISVYAETPKRIISLAPSITEILFSAGLGDRIVGVTTFCDHPAEAKDKPKIGGMVNPSLEAIVRLKPDIVILTTDGNPEEIYHRLKDVRIKTHVFKARRINELPDGIRELGIVLEEEERFNALALRIEEAIERFKDRRQRTENRGQGRRVVFIIWPEPLMVVGPGTAIDEAINLLGAVNIARDARIQYPKYSVEEIVRQSPDIIFIGRAEGMDMQETSRGLLERISYIPAARENRVFYVSDSLYRLGPRVIEGLEELAGYLSEKK